VPVPQRSTKPFRPAIDGLLLGVRSGTFFVCGLSTNGLIDTHLIPAATDHGMTAVAGASLLALMGVFDVIGTTLSGWLPTGWIRGSCSPGTTCCAGWP
jgi:hypothetical protein